MTASSSSTNSTYVSMCLSGRRCSCCGRGVSQARAWEEVRFATAGRLHHQQCRSSWLTASRTQLPTSRSRAGIFPLALGPPRGLVSGEELAFPPPAAGQEEGEGRRLFSSSSCSYPVDFYTIRRLNGHVSRRTGDTSLHDTGSSDTKCAVLALHHQRSFGNSGRFFPTPPTGKNRKRGNYRHRTYDSLFALF
jgi:hypothetical protein